MPTFKDLTGREFYVVIDADAIARIEKATGVNVDTLMDDLPALHALLEGDESASSRRVLYAIIEPQAWAHGLTAATWNHDFDASTAKAAYMALVDAMRIRWQDCPQAAHARAMLHHAWAAAAKMKVDH